MRDRAQFPFRKTLPHFHFATIEARFVSTGQRALRYLQFMGALLGFGP